MSPRMPVEYARKGIEELETLLDDLTEALSLGSQTGVAVSSGRQHQFRGLTYEQLQHRVNRVALALHLLYAEAHPDEDNPYPDPQQGKVMTVTTVHCE